MRCDCRFADRGYETKTTDGGPADERVAAGEQHVRVPDDSSDDPRGPDRVFGEIRGDRREEDLESIPPGAQGGFPAAGECPERPARKTLRDAASALPGRGEREAGAAAALEEVDGRPELFLLVELLHVELLRHVLDQNADESESVRIGVLGREHESRPLKQHLQLQREARRGVLIESVFLRRGLGDGVSRAGPRQAEAGEEAPGRRRRRRRRTAGI